MFRSDYWVIAHATPTIVVNGCRLHLEPALGRVDSVLIDLAIAREQDLLVVGSHQRRGPQTHGAQPTGGHMSDKYFGSWTSHKEFSNSWTDDYDSETRSYRPVGGMATDEEVLIASYGGAAYEGDAFVLFQRDGKLYEVHGSHCSCYGLEGQWSPEETTWAAVATRPWHEPLGSYENPFDDHDQAALDRMLELLATHVPQHAA